MRRNLITKALAKRRDGESPIYLFYGVSKYYTQISCNPDFFIPSSGTISTEDPQASLKNAKLEMMRSKLMMELLYREVDDKQFVPLCLSLFEPEKVQKKNSRKYADIHKMYIEHHTKPNTIYTYELTASKVREFDPEADLNKIDLRWLEHFDEFLKGKGYNVNGVGIHMRNIRAVFNYAIKHDLTTNYPFKLYHIEKEETRKRNLSVEQVRELRDFPCTKYQERYRDIFMLMLYLRGINPVDLFTATPDMVVNGRLEYNRTKTGAFLSVKIEPEAQAIIEKYKGKKRLLNVAENIKWRTFNQHMERELKKIGVPPRKKGEAKRTPEQIRSLSAFPDLTPYWSRYTWASLAAECDASKVTIGKGLSHAWANVTDTYINVGMRKVDEANRNVIDYIKGGYKTTKQLEEENKELQRQLQTLLEKISMQNPQSPL